MKLPFSREAVKQAIENLFVKSYKGDSITIGHYDNLTLEQADGSIELSTPERKISDDYKICPKCAGELYLIIPEVSLNGLSLCECQRCKERCYKKLTLDEIGKV